MAEDFAMATLRYSGNGAEVWLERCPKCRRIKPFNHAQTCMLGHSPVEFRAELLQTVEGER